MPKLAKQGKHSWRPGFPNKKIPVKVVANELQAIERENGILEPEAVVKSAKAKNSPLHKFFTWDDTVAAQEYRLEQARGLIRAVIVEVKVENKSYNVRAYYNITDETEPRSYRAVSEITANQAHLDRVVERAWAELEAWQARYDNLVGLQVAVEHVRAALEKRPKKVKRKSVSHRGARV